MSLLCDKQLQAFVQQNGVIGLNLQGRSDKENPIQASSIDLHIGEVFIPGVVDHNGLPNPKKDVVLLEGHTAVVRTKEELRLPANLAGICFPPSRVAFKGLLMTNPGHIDPGYNGALRFTVINMGKEPYTLREGDAISTLLVLKLSENSEKDWLIRNPKPNPPPDPAPDYRISLGDALDRLSADFLNVSKRADEAVSRAETKTKWFIAVGTIAAPILLAVVSWGLSKLQWGTQQDLSKLEQRVTVIEQKLDVDKMRTQVDSLELKTDKLEKLLGKRSYLKPNHVINH